MNWKNNFYSIAVAIILFCTSVLAEYSVTISHIQGLDPARGLKTHFKIRYYINFETENINDGELTYFQHGFRVYSPDSAAWTPPTQVPVIMLSNYYDVIAFQGTSLDGSGADSLSVICGTISSQGLPKGFNGDIYYIETEVTADQIGKTICFDSSRVELVGWLWQTGNGTFSPSWSGPVCFPVVDCCNGRRGDVNGDGNGPNTLDLSRMVDYLFRGAPVPACDDETDVNGDGLPHRINDLTYIVDYLHRGGPPPPNCPGR
jgi:hypothetical protein